MAEAPKRPHAEDDSEIAATQRARAISSEVDELRDSEIAATQQSDFERSGTLRDSEIAATQHARAISSEVDTLRDSEIAVTQHAKAVSVIPQPPKRL